MAAPPHACLCMEECYACMCVCGIVVRYDLIVCFSHLDVCIVVVKASCCGPQNGAIYSLLVNTNRAMIPTSINFALGYSFNTIVTIPTYGKNLQ